MYSILIVDDEPMTREYMRLHIPLINSEWYVGYEAANGSDALEILKKNPVDLVITDIRMPKMDGLELCKAIREYDEDQFIVILSGYDEFSYSREAIKYGVNEYLLKPIESGSLSETLEIVKSKLMTRKQDLENYRTLGSIASEYNRNILNSYLQALVNNNKTQQRALSFLIEKHELSPVHTSGILMVFSLDIECLVDLKLPFDDFEVFNYIMFQVINEHILEYNHAYAYLDDSQNTVVYLAEQQDKLQITANSIYEYINNFMIVNTGFSVTAGCYKDIATTDDFHMAFKHAQSALDYKLIHFQSGIYFYGIKDQEQLKSMSLYLNNVINEFNLSLSEAFKSSLTNYFSSCTNFGKKEAVILSVKLLSALHKAIREELTNPSWYHQSFNLLIDELTNETEFNTLTDVSHILNIVNLLKNDSGEKNIENSAYIHYIRCKNYINENFCKVISLSQIADHVGVSTNYLSNIFREYEGQSYIKYITKCRMEYAVKQIKQDPNKKISSISRDCGYSNIKHFHYVFKQHYKMTPGEYQKLQI